MTDLALLKSKLSAKVGGAPLSKEEIKIVLRVYLYFKENHSSYIAEKVHEATGISKKKIVELWREFESTREVPHPKIRHAWNKGHETHGSTTSRNSGDVGR